MSIEILAPAGSADALQAAVRCGAAAVYLGAGQFNARRHAANFDGDALRRAVEYCHVRGVKVHLTLNTLLRENELPAAMKLVQEACALGVDALIVQDMGLARHIRAAAPAMPLHASTQLSCHTPDGVAFLRDNGFSRVVLSREMSLEEIRACAGLGCELEVFVHGALCMCVSGQCYLSAALGGRSGNRGLCAQPCRLPFSAPDTADLTGGYALSLKDQSLVAHIRELADAGVVSLKIEGRMKRPEYVAAATAVCRAAADGEKPDAGVLDDLGAVFSRSGFTDGYYTGKRGTAMFGTRRKEDIAENAVLSRLSALYRRERQCIPVTLALTAAVGEKTVLTAADAQGHHLTVIGDAAAPARTVPTTAERAAAQLTKTGDTPYVATAQVSLGENAVLPAAVINALRREALEKLSTMRAASEVPFFAVSPAPLPAAKPVRGTVLRLASAAQYSAALESHAVILPLSTPPETVRDIKERHKAPLGIEIPRGVFGGTAAVSRALSKAKDAGAGFVLCGNCNAIPAAKAAGLPLVGGFGLNITNKAAVDAYAASGLAATLLSPELSFAQMTFARDASLPCGVLLYGRLPLMLTRNCPRKAAGADCRNCRKSGVLRDRKKADFPVQCENGCAELLNAVPTYWADKPNAVPPFLFALLHFTTETEREVAAVVTAYATAAAPTFPFTRGMYRNGVE